MFREKYAGVFYAERKCTNQKWEQAAYGQCLSGGANLIHIP